MLEYEYEFEALPELEGEYEYEGEWEGEYEGEFETEEFFRTLAGLARRGAGTARQAWRDVQTPGTRLRTAALAGARAALGGLGNVGRAVGGDGVGGAIGQSVGSGLGTFLGGVLPEREYEFEWEGEFEEELNPIRRVYPDALMEHLGHAATAAQSEAEAEAFIGALIPLAARLIPRVAPAIMRVAPRLIRGAANVTRVLRRSPATRPLVRTLPTIVRRTAGNLAQQARQGQPITPQTAVRTLARQTARVIGSPQQAVQAYRRSRVGDTQYHQTQGSALPGPAAAANGSTACATCGGM